MTRKKIELDVDFIGVQEGLTKEEEKALSDFFKKRKLSPQQRSTKNRTNTVKRSKTTT